MEFAAKERTIDALDRLLLALRDLRESLEAEPAKAEAPQDLTVYAVPQQAHEPEAKPETTFDEVKAVLIGKSREGKTAMVKMLLERFHAASLQDVDPADYTELLEAGKRL